MRYRSTNGLARKGCLPSGQGPTLPLFGVLSWPFLASRQTLSRLTQPRTVLHLRTPPDTRRPLLRCFEHLGPDVRAWARENLHCHPAKGAQDLEARADGTAASRRQKHALKIKNYSGPQGTLHETGEILERGRGVYQRSRSPTGVRRKGNAGASGTGAVASAGSVGVGVDRVDLVISYYLSINSFVHTSSREVLGPKMTSDRKRPPHITNARHFV